MSLSLRLIAVSAAFAFAGTAFAASSAPTVAAKPHTAQQQRMVNCNKQATGKKGAERKAFMSSCLKGKNTAESTVDAKPAASDAKIAQREKMKTCNAEAKTKALKDAARKSFMSSCLKAH